jgi:ComF family protein
LVQALKFHARLDLAPALAERMLSAWHAAGVGAPGLLLPMPLAASRWRERGHNQAWELARRLARALGAPADPQLLLRVKDTPHQIALPRRDRAANVRGAFAVEPLRAAGLRGRSVTLVDDVVTTGATAAEAARTLRQAGAAAVTLWVAARTPHRAGGPD